MNLKNVEGSARAILQQTAEYVREMVENNSARALRELERASKDIALLNSESLGRLIEKSVFVGTKVFGGVDGYPDRLEEEAIVIGIGHRRSETIGHVPVSMTKNYRVIVLMLPESEALHVQGK